MKYQKDTKLAIQDFNRLAKKIVKKFGLETISPETSRLSLAIQQSYYKGLSTGNDYKLYISSFYKNEKTDNKEIKNKILTSLDCI